MRILEINKFYNSRRGADKHFMDVTELLEKNGHETAVFAMAQNDDQPSPWSKYFPSTVGYTDAFTFRQRLGGAFRMFYSPEAHRKISSLLDEFKPDVAHIHNIYHQLDPTILFEIKKRGIPIVMTVHDYKLINPNHALFLRGLPYTRGRHGKYYQCILDRCVKNSYAKSSLAALEMYWHTFLGTYAKNIDCYIAPSEYVKKTLLEWGMAENKIRVLPHFISAPMTTPRIGSATKENYAFYAGKISKQKGVDELMNIFAKISGLSLYLAGEVEEGFEIPVSDKVKYLGILPKKELVEFVRGAKCVVSGTRLPETFGLVALEAIAEGKPFIGFNTGAFSEIIQNGQNGYLVQSEAEFVSLIEKIAADEIVWDSVKIQKNADEKYGESTYVRNLTAIFESPNQHLTKT